MSRRDEKKSVSRNLQGISRKKDQRINAPLISLKTILLIFTAMVGLVVAISFIIYYLPNRVWTVISLTGVFLVGSAAALTIVFTIMQRYLYGKPIQIIADAARQVSEGDFTVRIEPIRKDGKKNEIEVLIEDFNRMVQQLESTEILKSDFISNVSHEIKAPLSVIQSYSTALKDPTLTEEQQRQYADIIIQSTRDMSEMISNILKLNKLEHQEIVPISALYPVGEQIRRCALHFMNQWEEKEIEFYIDVVDVMIPYDDTLLELVWNNFISNAVKFTPKGGKISLTSWREGNLLKVQIQDTGIGMDEKTMENIFDKFYQGDLSHSTKGNGLGLALAKRVLELVDGTVEVRSEVDKGSTFVITLEM